MSCCSKIADAVKGIIKKLRPLIAVALMVFAVYLLVVSGGTVPPLMLAEALGGWVALPAVIGEMSAATAAYLSLGVACLVDGDTVVATVGKVTETAGRVAGTIVAAATGGFVDGLLNGGSSGGIGVVGFIVAGALAWWLLTRDKKEETEEERLAREKREVKEAAALQERKDDLRASGKTYDLASTPTSEFMTPPNDWGPFPSSGQPLNLT